MRKIRVAWGALPSDCGRCPLLLGDTSAKMLCVCPIMNESVSKNTNPKLGRPDLCPLELKRQEN